MTFGHDPDIWNGGFNHDQAFDGHMDEFRLWKSVRSPAQIKKWMNRNLDLTDPDNNQGDLSIYFTFDNIDYNHPDSQYFWPGMSASLLSLSFASSG
jgi:hypothetical protein